jgi:hypothetical protein
MSGLLRNPTAGKKDDKSGGGSGGGNDGGGKSGASKKLAVDFLLGKGDLSSAVLAALHQHLPPQIAQKVISSHKKGAKLGAKVSAGDDLEKIVKDPKFQWNDDKGDKGGAKGEKGGDKGAIEGLFAAAASAAGQNLAKMPPLVSKAASSLIKGLEAPAPKAAGPAAAPKGGGGGGAGGGGAAMGGGAKGDVKGADAKGDAKGGAGGKADAKGAGPDAKGGGPDAKSDEKGDAGADAKGQKGGDDAKAGAKGDKGADAKGDKGDGDGADTKGDDKNKDGAVKADAQGGNTKGDAKDDAKGDKAAGGVQDGVKGAANAKGTAPDGKGDAKGQKGDPAGAAGDVKDAVKGAKNIPDGGGADVKGADTKGVGADTKGAPGGAPAATAKGGTKGAAPSTGAAGVKGGAPANAGGGGGGAGGGPAPAPKGGGVGTRAPDGLVDHYMETHWDSKEFYDWVAKIGHYPDAIGSELDHWLPPTMSPSTRGTLNMVAGAAGGLLDSVVMGIAGALPGVGSIISLLGGIQSYLQAEKQYGKEGLKDPDGETLAKSRVVLTTITSVCSNLADTCTFVEDLCHGITVASGGVGGITEIVGVPVTAIGEVLRAIGAGTAVAGTLCDAALFFHDKQKANEAEARGDFTTAGQYRDLMFSDVVNGVKDGITAVTSVISVCSANTVGGESAATSAEEAIEKALKKALVGTGDKKDAEGNVVKNAAGQKLQVIKPVTLGNAASQQKKAAAGVLGATKTGAKGSSGANGTGVGEIWANAKAWAGLGDAMSANPDAMFGEHFVPRNAAVGGSGPEHDILQAARTGTINGLSKDYEGLVAAPPEWTQKLINDIANPSKTKLDNEIAALDISPSTQIKNLLKSIRGVSGMIGDGSLDTMAAVCDKMADKLNTWLQPVINNVNKYVAENKPHLNEILKGWNDTLQKQQLNLQKIDDWLKGANDMVGKVSQVAEKGGYLDTEADKLIAAIGKLGNIDRNTLHIPSIVPDFIINPLLGKLRNFVGEMQNRARGMKQEALDALNKQVQGVIKSVQAKISEFEKMFAQGSEFRAACEKQFEGFKAMVDAAIQAFTQWDGQIHFDIAGAGTWLKEVAKQARKKTDKAKEDRWKTEALPQAQAEVDQWRSQHGDQVKSQYYPQVPSAEIDACNRVNQMLSNKLAPLLASHDPGVQAEAQQAKSALSTAMNGVKGGQGKEAVLNLWAAEEALAQVAMLPIFSRGGVDAPPDTDTDPNNKNNKNNPNHPNNPNQPPATATA